MNLSTLFRNRSRQTFITAGAILALLILVALAAMNATATPRSPEQVQIQGWINALQTDKLTTARQQAQRNLELAGEQAVPQLLVALRSNNSVLRRNAADMLGYIASPQATDALINTLRSDPVPSVRRNAAYALGEIHDVRAINDLQKAAVADPSHIVRGTAADSLARVRTVLAKASNVNEQHIGAYAAAFLPQDLVYLAVKRDVLVSRDGGKTWETLSQVLPTQVTALTVNPGKAQELYAGTEGMGIFKSSDGGKTWNAINRGIELNPGARQAITAIAIDPENPNVLYIARGVWLGETDAQFYPNGLMTSHDGGNSWIALNAGSHAAAIAKLTFRDGQLFGLAGDRVLALATPQ